MKTHHKIIAWLIIVSVLISSSYVFIDSFAFCKGSSSDALTPRVTSNKQYSRSAITVFFLIIGFIAAFKVSKTGRKEEQQRKISAAIEGSIDGVAIFNAADECVYANKSYAIFNSCEGPPDVIGKKWSRFHDHEEYERIQSTLRTSLQMNGKWIGELTGRLKNGKAFFHEASLTMLEDGGFLCIVRDFTSRKRFEEQILRSERFLDSIFNSIYDPFCIFDRDFKIILANEAYALLKGKSRDRLIGGKCHEVLERKAEVCEDCVVKKTFLSSDPCAREKQVTTDGIESWVEIYTYPILDENEAVSHVIEYTRDITERKKAEDYRRKHIERLEHLSRTDGLTGLMNRRALTDILSIEIDRAKRYKLELSIILCDIDHFKNINDTYGHDAGDRALQLLSGTLKTMLRKTDIAGRYGGDEFMLILTNTSISGAESLAEKIASGMRNTDLCLPDGKILRLSISMGVVGLSGETDDIDSVVKRADDAMYSSKRSARSGISTMRFNF